MSSNPKNPKTSPWRDVSLRPLLTQAARVAVGDSPVRLEFDIPADAQSPVDPECLVELVRAMVRGSLDCLSADGEIMLTFWQTADSCEIEIADNGPAIESRPRRLPMVAASIGAEMLWQNCPQGGAAVTAKLRRPLALRDAA